MVPAFVVPSHVNRISISLSSSLPPSPLSILLNKYHLLLFPFAFNSRYILCARQINAGTPILVRGRAARRRHRG